MTNDTFNILIQELDEWSDLNTTAELWWRDDDASEPCEELDHLFRLSATHAAPCGLAAVPARTGEALRKDVSEQTHIWILQHGWAHINYATGDKGAWELGLHRPKSVVLDELREGMLKFSQLFKGRFLPVLVPPWNRMDPELLFYLPVMGYQGISASYERDRVTPPADLRVADVHCDLLSWKKKPAVFAGAEKCVKRIVSHLHDKRTGATDPNEPTGILTHHLAMDDEAWAFTDALLSLVNTHPAAVWISPADIWSA